jgi:hypothetical protein
MEINIYEETGLKSFNNNNNEWCITLYGDDDIDTSVLYISII